MKVLCVADLGILPEAMENACKTFLPGAECVVENFPVKSVEFLGKIEENGPDSIEPLEQFKKHAGEDFDVLIGAIMVPISTQVLDMFPNVKVVGTCRGGLEDVNMQACKDRNIMVVNAYGRNAEAVSDFTMALMLSELRNVARSHADLTRNGDKETWCTDWVNSSYTPHMCESTIGIVGYGYIGRLVAKKCAGFGSKIMVYDEFVSEDEIRKDGYIPVSKEELFKTADIVSIHLRLVDATRGAISRKDIDSMKKTAVFINTARAGVVDYDALYDALAEKRIGGAAVDVYPEEPLPADSKWRKLDNITITAHMAGSVLASRPYAAKLITSSIATAVKGGTTPQIITKDILKTDEFKEWASTQYDALVEK